MSCPPVLLIGFNRPDHLRRCLEVLLDTEMNKLYFSCDAPRAHKTEEADLVLASRSLVEEKTRGKVDLKTNYFSTNQGCKKGPEGAMDWFFSHEEAGIILEDDILIHPSFLTWAGELLQRYQADTRIFQISAINYQSGVRRGDGSYYFSRGGCTWAWATWRRAWLLYDRNFETLGRFLEGGFLDGLLADPLQREVRKRNFLSVQEQNRDAWDYGWAYSIYSQNGLCVIPQVSMARNIGFDGSGTHTNSLNRKYTEQKIEQAEAVIAPTFVLPDMEADAADFYYHHDRRALERILFPGWFQRGKNIIKKLLGR